MYERILIAVASTPNEGAVVEHATMLASLSGAALHVVHVTPLHLISEDVVAGSGLGVVTGDGDVEPAEKNLVADLLKKLRSAGVPVTGEVVSATEHDTARAITERARATNADLLILGESHHRGPSKLFRASVAAEIVHHSLPCAVLLVP
jgi:nucleotide-binding universal stress UspA family protein